MNAQAMDESDENGAPPRAKRQRCAVACETCKRRKERCDGHQPCGRCVERAVSNQCYFVEHPSRRRRTSDRAAHKGRRSGIGSTPIVPDSLRETQLVDDAADTLQPSTSGLDTRLLLDPRGRYMFIGDSANLSFLQVVRRVVHECIGSCLFVDDPLRSLMVEVSPEGQPSWIEASSQREPPTVSIREAELFIKRYVLTTNCILDLFDEADLFDNLLAWTDGRWIESSIPSPIYYLVLAIGAQTSPEDRDKFAETSFTYGRYLTARDCMEDASLLTVQSYALITMYLLGASRRNAAFMHLGIAVRAAYAIGLHRKDVALSLPKDDFKVRERLWKALRTLDLFMSASLGRPPSTSETRETEADKDYSTSNDLCSIFEKILTDVYSRRMISTEALRRIGAHHRRWASRFFRDLAADRVEPFASLSSDCIPNIGLLHIKEAYYWSIMLLTRPFFVESVMLHVRASNARKTAEPCTASDSNKIPVHACIDSAIRTIDLLKVLLGRGDLPKRLPFINNSIFNAALVIGLAFFGDLYQVFPLKRHLKIAHRLLVQFPHDAIAVRNANIVGFLREACDNYLEKRSAEILDCQNLGVRSMFGQIHHPISQRSTRDQTPSSSAAAVETDDPREAGLGQMIVPVAIAQAEQQLAITNNAQDSYLLDPAMDFDAMPYPTMSPRTLWFDTHNDNTPLFSTTNAYDTYPTLSVWDAA